MNNIFKYSLKGGALGVIALMGLSSCTDDHFDVFAGDGTSNQSIWQNIKSNDQLSDMADILSRAYMMRFETDRIDPTTTKTLAQLLDEPQSFTVWAPLNGSYDPKHYLDILDQAEAEYAANGVTTDYLKLQYQVASQFAYQHVARFNYESVAGNQQVILLNGKKVNYSSGENVFNGVSLTGAPVVSSNGTLHLLSQPSPFAYNIYDYISSQDNLSKLRSYLLDPSIDKYTFSENSSVEGALNENGDMVYVDSIYSHTNEILNRCGAQLQNEDSTYVALLPNDNAWDKAVEDLKKYFNYQKTYYYSWSNSNGRFSNSTAATAYQLDADSLMDYNVKAAMIQSAFFTPSIWHGISADKTYDEVVNYALHADSLVSTNRTCFYNSNPGGVNPMFGETEPVKASNGYIFDVDDYQVRPEYVWMERREIQATSPYFMAQAVTTNSHCTEMNGSTITLTAANRYNEIIDPYKVSTYQRFQRDGRNSMTVDYRLQNLLSGAYTVKAILAPSRYCYDIQPDSTITEVSTFYVQVLDDKGNALEIAEGNNGTSKANKVRSVEFTVDQDQVKEYVVIPKIEIPYCYYNLPAGVDSFCRLRFTSAYDRKTTSEGDGLNIYKIIIEPYRGAATTESEEN